MAKKKRKTNGISDKNEFQDVNIITIPTQEEVWEDIRLKRFVPPNALSDIKLTEKQVKLINVINNNKVIVIFGPAGTSKTFISCYYLVSALKNHSFEKVILTKPLKEAGEQLGFLPGEIENKIDPFYESFANNLIKIIKEPNYKKLLEKKTIQCKPLAYLRGTGFDNSLMILDEAQNATMKQLMLFITRMGKGSKIIINGDVRQYDIEKNNVALPFLMENVLKGIDEVDTFEFNEDDIMRDEILIEITKRYELLKNEGKIPKNF